MYNLDGVDCKACGEEEGMKPDLGYCAACGEPETTPPKGMEDLIAEAEAALYSLVEEIEAAASRQLEDDTLEACESAAEDLHEALATVADLYELTESLNSSAV
tara:strand:- start:50 stop:358 length:309 start_codon:yes stop_codon:yes gene_type:complete